MGKTVRIRKSSLTKISDLNPFFSETESWEVADDAKRYRHQPEFEGYYWYPEIFVVDTKYCPEGRDVQFSSFDPTASKMIMTNQRRFDNARAAKKAKENY